jgi:excinuclease ABC subunit B
MNNEDATSTQETPTDARDATPTQETPTDARDATPTQETQTDPFDITKALEGAIEEHLNPDVAKFVLDTDMQPAGDQENAIKELSIQLENSQERCILLGVTGSGKTFAMAHLIERLNIPTLVMSHNKTLARQLYHEFSALFPSNAVEYYVSHYDYYQPEAYLPKRDLYIDKELSINERVEQERFSTVASLVSRPDVLVVSSVSCIYGLNSPETFLSKHCRVHVGQAIEPMRLVKELVKLQYIRSTTDISRGQLRLRGEILDIWMPSRDDPLRIRFGFDGVERIQVCDPVSWEVIDELEEAWIHPKEFYITSKERYSVALELIEEELEHSVREFKSQDKEIEAHRLEQRTRYDLELLMEIGHCPGVENYSMHFDGRSTGERPYCLLDFMAACAKQFHGDPEKFLIIMDESHVSLPQTAGMFGGDSSRKKNLIEHGFRLPSAADNRPLKIAEFQSLAPRMVYVSATPGERELRHLCEVTGQEPPKGLLHVTGGGGAIPAELEKKHPEAESMHSMLGIIDGIVRMEIRPTGLLDPELEVRPTEGQVQDLLSEINERIENDERVLVTVLTIKFAEEVSEYLGKMGIKSQYLHSEIDTIERTEIIKALRLGLIDVIVGINLLREGLDIPEVSLVAIFDADRQGFLRNERSLLQTIGRASRNVRGRVILYADSISASMRAAIEQTLDRREKQISHNLEHGIEPKTISKPMPTMGADFEDLISGTAGSGSKGGRRLVSSKGGRVDDGMAHGLEMGAGSWASSDDVLSRISQPSSINDFPIEESEMQLESNEAIKLLKKLKNSMEEAARMLDFEKAAALRDRIFELESQI